MDWLPISIDGSDDPLPLGADPCDILECLAEMLERPTWHRSAKCRGQVDVFFTERGQDTRPAKEVCAECPVATDCAEAGRREHFGIWAGTSERQRRQLRRRAA